MRVAVQEEAGPSMPGPTSPAAERQVRAEKVERAAQEEQREAAEQVA